MRCRCAGASQFYPQALATQQDVYNDPALFHRTWNELNAALGTKIVKMMRLGGQELDLHVLYQRVRPPVNIGSQHCWCSRKLDALRRYRTWLLLPYAKPEAEAQASVRLHRMQVSAEGGSEQVIQLKRWRDVGDVFKLPKTITSLSFVLRRGYMQYLWDYEQVYLHRRGGQRRVAPPAQRQLKEPGKSKSKSKNGGGGYTASTAPLPASSEVETAAAIAVAALRKSYAQTPHCNSCCARYSHVRHSRDQARRFLQLTYSKPRLGCRQCR